MRAALYARYSSDRQNERSIQDQLAVCARHAESRGWVVVATFSDAAISGAAMANRPGIQSLLAAAVSSSFDVVLVEDEDRLARNLEHQANIFNRLRHAGVSIATLSNDRIGILEVGLKGVMGELYLINLGQKTSRGMRANAEEGLATGSRLYGYRSEPGGATAIVESEAQVIREIFQGYARGATGRDLASALNVSKVPGPRGGLWNASSINGSRQRGNGILNTELYAGVKVWNRMEVRKDPMTGKRLPIMRPMSEWRRTPVESLRIISQELWDAVRARKALEDRERPLNRVRRKRSGLFAGLLKCGFCGGAYTTYSHDRLICAAHREKGDSACGNNRTVSRTAIETRVLEGLRTRLLTPAAVAAYVRAYSEAWEAAAAERRERRNPIERRIAELHRSIERVVDAVCDGVATRPMLDRMTAQEAEKVALEAELAALDLDKKPEITVHPRAADHYARMVEQLQSNLAELSNATDADSRDLIASVRGLVEKIEIIPMSPEPGGPVSLTLHGDLARFMEPPVDNFRSSGVRVVAGGGIEPPTCGL